ncbi:P-loop NTPase family protein [[Clostridium] fimetarium]|uniref:Adenylate kinase n=1 Tax=[Clostridium] fimetarium TaxID=99656 RepID=A0A1I0QUX6_9FIRM|nr:DNA topology modulation protein FlaR [[Clostridium] fimetarium]SEW31235.1 Adenylate kinase [[Clostridium] fimetarium]
MKIDIIGSVASGKTTLAATISKTYKVPFYEKDNIVWVRTNQGDVRRPEDQRNNLFQSIIGADDWIVEGSPRKILNQSFDVCDYIILLDINILVRLKRVFIRWVRQRVGVELYNSEPTIKSLKYNIKWVFEFNNDREEILDRLSSYDDKFKVFRNSKDAEKFIIQVYGKTGL